MIVLIIFLFILYILLEGYRYGKYIKRVNELNNRKATRTVPIDYAEYILNNLDIWEDKKEMMKIFFGGKDYKLLTKREVREFFIENLIDNHADYYEVMNNEDKNIQERLDIIEEIIFRLEEDLEHSFKDHELIREESTEKMKQIQTFKDDKKKYFVSGKIPLKPYFKPVFFTYGYRLFRSYINNKMDKDGFVFKTDHNGITSIVRDNNNPKIDKTLLLLHGLGIGYTPYYKIIKTFYDYKKLIVIEMPNISYGHHVHSYPKMKQIQESIFNILQKQKCQDTEIDIFGHSYGTILAGYVLNRKDDMFNFLKIDKIMLLDPVCFVDSIPDLTKIVMIDNFEEFCKIKQLNKDDNQSIKDKLGMLFNYYMMVGDFHNQILFKRHIFSHEIILKKKNLNDNTFIMMSEYDKYTNATKLYESLNKESNLNVMLMKDVSHADIVFKSDLFKKFKEFAYQNEHNKK